VGTVLLLRFAALASLDPDVLLVVGAWAAARAAVATVPRVVAGLGPAGMRSDWLMTLALRWMGNLVDEADRDRAARVWRWAGRRSIARDARPPFS
jgi:hypothetical protein